MTRRPRLVLAMHETTAVDLLGAAHWERLRALADVLDEVPLTSFRDERARSLLERADVLLTGWGVPPLDAAALALAPNLRAVVHAAGSVKGFISDACWSRPLSITSVAAANARPVAEFTLAAILLAGKGVFRAQAMYRAHRTLPPWREAGPTPGNREKRVGVIGASKVGRQVIALLAPFEFELVVSDPLLTLDEAGRLAVTLVELDELLATSDIVSVHAPLLAATTGLLDARRLALLKDGATLINTARGAIIDAAALEAELVQGRLNAVIDTTDPEPLPAESPLYDLPNVFLTPHIAGSTGTELGRLADAALDELERFAADLPFAHEITAEDLPWIA